MRRTYLSSICIASLMAINLVAPFSAFAEVKITEPNENGEYLFQDEYTLTESNIAAEDYSSAEVKDSKSKVIELAGVDRYNTSASQALYAYPKSSKAIIASGSAYADSVAAGGLAGALDCPIILTESYQLSSTAEKAMKSMGVKEVIIVGSQAVVSDAVAEQIQSRLGAKVERLAGVDRFGTQMEIYNYGKRNNLWSSSWGVVVTGTNFPDALAVSPVTFSLKAPVFYCDYSNDLYDKEIEAIKSSSNLKSFMVIGSEAVTSKAAFNFLSNLSSSRGGKTVRLGGVDRYNTSFAIGEYAVENFGFTWDKVAFATGQVPYDSLGGGVVQGKDKAPLLLADSLTHSVANLVVDAGGKISTHIKFFGSSAAIANDVRMAICQILNIGSYQVVEEKHYDITRSRMASLQVARNEGNGYGYNDFYNALDPAKAKRGTSAFYQFAVLNAGYSGLSSDTLNNFVASNCGYSESSYQVKSNLRNTGSYFTEAAATYNVNEAYLLAHAIWESAWGCSELARGWTPDRDGVVIVNGKSYPYSKGTTYYNFYGIGAFDANALSGGRAMAVKEGWTSPRQAILGAAEWIAENYLNRTPDTQNTLYLMKWDVAGAARTGSAWHEYCTGLDSWVLGISSVMSSCYRAGGYTPDTAPVYFNYPVYSGD